MWQGEERDRPYHPVADLFPLLEGAEYEEFKADVALHGQREPIWLAPDASILDGRNRHRACLELGRKPNCRMYVGGHSFYSLMEFVLSMNLHRRHLNSGQRATIAVKAHELVQRLDEEAKKRQGRRTDLTSVKSLTEVPPDRSEDQLATLFDTNRQYVHDAKMLQQEAPDLLQQVRSGEKSLPQAWREHKALQRSEQRDTMAVHYSSATPEHYTPKVIIDATLACTEEIDLDPCSNSHEQPNVPAAQHFTAEDDGLAQEWHGRIYMNPPYGREIDGWIAKLCAEHEAGRVTEAIALVPARTDTQWWLRLRDYPVCFIVGRLTFGGNDDPAPFPSAVFYLGEEIGNFYRAFSQLGDCWQRMEPGISFGE